VRGRVSKLSPKVNSVDFFDTAVGKGNEKEKGISKDESAARIVHTPSSF
jgi:hypothetical protein